MNLENRRKKKKNLITFKINNKTKNKSTFTIQSFHVNFACVCVASLNVMCVCACGATVNAFRIECWFWKIVNRLANGNFRRYNFKLATQLICAFPTSQTCCWPFYSCSSCDFIIQSLECVMSVCTTCAIRIK